MLRRCFDATLVLSHSFILGLAGWALAPVHTVKTGASAQSANLLNPTFKL